MEATEQQLIDTNNKLDNIIDNDTFMQGQLNDINGNILLLIDDVEKLDLAKEEKEATEGAKGGEASPSDAETTEQLLVEIRDSIDTGNKIDAINGLFIGIVIGLLFIKILFDNIRGN